MWPLRGVLSTFRFALRMLTVAHFWRDTFLRSPSQARWGFVTPGMLASCSHGSQPSSGLVPLPRPGNKQGGLDADIWAMVEKCKGKVRACATLLAWGNRFGVPRVCLPCRALPALLGPPVASRSFSLRCLIRSAPGCLSGVFIVFGGVFRVLQTDVFRRNLNFSCVLNFLLFC